MSPPTPSKSAHELGGTVVACSDSSGYVVDELGIDLDVLKAKSRRFNGAGLSTMRACAVRMRNLLAAAVSGCARRHSDSVRHAERTRWQDAKQLIDHGVTIVAEGANMPCSPRPFGCSPTPVCCLHR